MVFFLDRTFCRNAEDAMGMPGGEGQHVFGHYGDKNEKVVRRLILSCILGKVTSLITLIQPERAEDHTVMMFCTNVYPAKLAFRTCEHCITIAAAAWPPCPLQLPSQTPEKQPPCARWRDLARRPLPCWKLRPTARRLRRRGSLRL